MSAPHIHVFSSGPNRDGNWSAMQGVTDTCHSVAFHFDEFEFDSWTHFVAADALVISKSSFSLIPALFSVGEVYLPSTYWVKRLSHWNLFDDKNVSPLLPL